MARIFISGSSSGLGFMAAGLLSDLGHSVVLHSRNRERADDVRFKLPSAEAVVVGDVSTIEGAISVADQVNALGVFDAVIHNVAVGHREPHRLTLDGLPTVFAVNTLAPYILSAAISRPRRLIYVSSGMHQHADVALQDLLWEGRHWNATQAYAESKLHNVILAFSIARLWSDVLSNALEPGWVATRMGGAGAPDDLNLAHRTQVWLSVSDDVLAMQTGKYFYHQKEVNPNAEARRADLQDQFLAACERLTGLNIAG